MSAAKRRRTIGNFGDDNASQIAGFSVSTSTPTTENVLKYNGTQWTPTSSVTNLSLTTPTVTTGTIKSDTNWVDSTTPTKKAKIDVSGATATKTATLAFAQTVDRTYTFPDATDTVALLAASQLLQTKNLQVGGGAGNCKLVDGTDTTKSISFDLATAATNTHTTFSCVQTANRSIQFPDATVTLASLTGTEALTNKLVTFQNSGMSGGTPTQMGIYYGYSASKTFTPSGGTGGTFSANPSATLNLERLDGFVLFNLIAFNATLGSGSAGTCTQLASAAAVPSGFRPSTNQQYSCFTQDGGTGFNGIVRVGTNGDITIFKDLNIDAWTNGNAIGLQFDLSFTYKL
jgi:hypothetical protein